VPVTVKAEHRQRQFSEPGIKKRQFEPYLRAFMAAPLRCGLPAAGLRDAVPEPGDPAMVEYYINPDFLKAAVDNRLYSISQCSGYDVSPAQVLLTGTCSSAAAGVTVQVRAATADHGPAKRLGFSGSSLSERISKLGCESINHFTRFSALLT
jgi:hypothetical protein